MFTIWDRVFGTLCEHDSKSPLFYDVPSNRRTHDGIATQWRLIVELAIKLRTTRSSRERLSLLFGRPAVEVSAQAITADVALDRASKRALTIAFTLIVIASTWLLWSRDSLPKPPVYFFALALLVAMHAIGRFMNRQRRESPARTEEIAID